MEIHKIIKDTILQNKAKIQLLQWGIASGISSLLYSEYLRRIQQKITPKRLIFVPPIKAVEEFLNPENQFMTWISDNLVDKMLDNDLFLKYLYAPEFQLFTNADNIEILKTIIDFHIIPNVSKSIPSIIGTKFDLYNPEQQVFYENKSIDLFERRAIIEEQFDFIVEETILQLLLLIPTMKKSIHIPEDNKDIVMNKDLILTIGNEKAICGIHFNKNIITNKSVIDLLKFVTSTTFLYVDAPANRFMIDTNPFNSVAIVTLEGIESNNSNEGD
jgi:hypothetical protein